MSRLATFLFIQLIFSAEGFLPNSIKSSKESYTSSNNGDPGSPLLLSPYIESGKIDEAKQLARVTIPGFPDVESYAGFFTVDKTYNSNLFFWYFPPVGWDTITKNGNLTSAFATVVWLQGGPGGSSLYGLFEENGPFFVKNNTFQARDISWIETSHVIYIDNPVGTGFSFANDSRGYCTNQTQIGEQLYTALYQFYQVFPEVLYCGLVISGESYGAKYAPALAKTIHEMNPKAKARGGLVLPLRGLTIGDGWWDPIHQLDYADFLYQTGLLDSNQRDAAEAIANKIRELIKKEQWSDATDEWHYLMYYLNREMGNISVYNLMKIRTNGSEIECTYCDLINTVDVKKAIHVGNLTYKILNDDVARYLKEDLMKSVAPWISELLEHYNLLTYNGQQDIIVAYPLTVNALRHLNWSGSEQYEHARRENAVYLNVFTFELFQPYSSKQTDNGNLMEVMIRNAGHMSPGDQPLWTLLLLEDWYNSRRITLEHAKMNTSVIKNTNLKQLKLSSSNK